MFTASMTPAHPPASQTSTAPAIGPYYGWIVWGTAAAFFAYGFAQRIAPSVMYDYLMRDFALGGAALGGLAVSYFYTYAAMQVPVGLLIDRFGPRVLLTLAALVCAAGSLIFGLANGLPQAYAGRLLLGVGTGVAFISTLMLANRWLPPERFGLVSGLTMSIGMLGAIGGQAPLGLLVEAIGWRNLLFAGSAVGVAFAGLIWIVTRAPTINGAAVSEAGEHRAPPFMTTLVLLAKQRQIWLAAFFCSTLSAPMLSFVILWGVPYLVQVQGLSRAAAGLGTSMVMIGLAFGAPFVGWLSDRVGARRPFILASPLVLLAIWLVVLFAPPLPTPAYYGLFLAIGLTSGVLTLPYAIGVELTRVEMRGAVTGVINLAPMLGAIVLQPAIGLVLDWQWTDEIDNGVRIYSRSAYVNALLVYPILMALTFVAMLFTVETYGRNRSPS